MIMVMAFDLLLKGGHLIDPKNDIDGPRDLVSFGAHYLWLRVLDLTR